MVNIITVNKFLSFIFMNAFLFMLSAPLYAEGVSDKRTFKVEFRKLDREVVKGTDGFDYIKLILPDAHFTTQQEGAPQIPIIHKRIEIPAQATKISLKIKTKGEVSLEGVIVYPVPKRILKDDGKSNYIDEEFYLDDAAYKQDAYSPDKQAEIKRDSFFRSTRILEIMVYPLQYNPKQRALRFYPSIEVEVDYQIDPKVPKPKDQMKHFKAFKEKLLISQWMDVLWELMPWAVTEAYAETMGGEVLYLTPANLKNTTNDIDYLIITHSDFYNSAELNEFANYRANTDGFRIGIVQIQDIYFIFSEYSGQDNKIRGFINYAYHNWVNSPVYLLLVGDMEWVPSHDDRVVVLGTLTDVYNNDDDWFTFGADNDPDAFDEIDDANMAVGRFPVRNSQQIGFIKRKIESYEKTAIVPGDYHEKVYLSEAEGLSFFSPMPQIYSILQKTGFNTQIASSSYPGGGCIDCGAFNSNFVLLNAHGSSTEMANATCSTASSYFYPDMCLSISPLWNWNTYPIVMTLSCNTADFDTSVSMGERFVNLENAGAVAYYGSTELTTLFQNLTEKTLNKIFDGFNYHLGRAIILAEIENSSEARIQVLFGDPALHAFGYRLTPGLPDLTLSSSDVTYDAGTTTLSVKVTNLGDTDARNVPVHTTLYDGSSAHPFADFTIPLVAAHSSAVGQVMVAAPLKGQYLVTAKIDPNNIITESFKLNNQNGQVCDTRAYDSVVTFLDNGQPVGGAYINAFSAINQGYLASARTDAQGKAKFSFNPDSKVYFQIEYYYNGARSKITSETVTAPVTLTINKPQVASRLNISYPENLFILQVRAINAVTGVTLGNATLVNANSSVDFLIPEGTSFYFSALTAPSESRSGTLTAPANVTMDLVPPTGSITINSNLAFTKTISVPLTLSSTDNSGVVSKIKVSNTNPADWSTILEENYTTTKSWNLTSGDGEKTVYIRFADAATPPNWSASFMDKIILDTKAPTATSSLGTTPPTGKITLNASATDPAPGSGIDKITYNIRQAKINVTNNTIAVYGTPMTVTKTSTKNADGSGPATFNPSTGVDVNKSWFASPTYSGVLYTVTGYDVAGNLLTSGKYYYDESTVKDFFTPDTTKPDKPTELSATQQETATQFKASWKAANDASEYVNYEVYREVNGTRTLINTTAVGATSYLDTKAVVGSKYLAKARDPWGNVSDWSDSILVGTDTQAPSPAPTGLTAVQYNGGNAAYVSFGGSTTDNSGVVSYEYYRALSPSTTFQKITTSSSKSYLDQGLTWNATYQYKVRAVDPSGNASGYSNTVTVTIVD